MTEFSDAQKQMHNARAALTAAQAALGQSSRELRALSVKASTVVRQADRVAATALRQRITVAQTANERLTADLAAAQRQLQTATGDFARFLDPRANLPYWSAAWPIALLPVRIETRFVTVPGDPPKPQLWLRIYPDDCWIDTFEPELSSSELDSVKRYWRAIWRAGGVDGDQRAAWRSLVAAVGNGRANYIADNYQPLNLADAPSPKVKSTDEILVIPTQTPLGATDSAAISAYWRAVWLADGDAGKTNAALSALQASVGVARATQLISDYVPFNLDDTPARPLSKQHVALSVAFVVFPPDPTTQPESWTQAPKVDQFPDCFVVLGFNGGAQTLIAVGTQVTLPLYVGPDPQAPPALTIHGDPATGDLFVPNQLKWLVDFPSAVAAGMGLAIDLTADQAAAGFDRLLVLGVQLSASAQDGEATLETLLGHHATGRSGLELIAQGTPTHNTTGTSSGYGRKEDPDVTFDDRKDAPLFSLTPDPMKKRDGQWLSEALGVDPAVFYTVHGAGSLDQIQRRAMQQLLWPATLGYWMDKLMTPVFSDDMVASTRWFFTNYVGGRGTVPAIRIGGQPYGVLPTTAFSRIAWLTEGYRGKALPVPGNQRLFLAQLYALLRKIDPDWTAMSQGASWVGKVGDPHQILLDIIGLHPASVEYYSRDAETVAELWNLTSLADLGPQFAQALAAVVQQVGASQLLTGLGYGGAPPDLLQQVFDSDAPLIQNVVDDRPLSETASVRAYTDDGRNYLQWLLDAAKSSLDALRLEQGFSGNQTPQTLLYLWMRHALMLGYFDASYFLYKSAGFLTPAQLAAMKPEPPFVHIDTSAPQSESRFAPLYAVDSRITGSPTLQVSDYITANYGALAAGQNFSEQLNALALLNATPTAALERLFAEHIDVCSYRFDSWLLGLVSVQLSAMRGTDSEQGQRGVYLGAYAWVEDLRPSRSAALPVQLPPDLAKVFAGPVALMQDPANGGYIHAPSIAHARTAAVLRSGYLANASAANPGTMAVDLSSDRVRLALSLLEGIRNGQSLGALLGYNFERGLHDDYGVAEVDKFIYPLRLAFPLVANAISDTADPNAPIQSLEARNVLDGRKLILQVQSSGNAAYPFGLGTLLPAATAQEAAAINAEVNRMLDAYDAVADLALGEGVHQAVQGNFDRIGATLDAYSSGNFPPDPEVVQSPANGVGLTHRVAVHLRPGLAAPAGATPRASAEPALDDFLQRLFPPLNQVACTVTWADPVTNAAGSRVVTLDRLALRPIDLLSLVLPDDAQAMAELDDRILDYVIAIDSPRPDTKLSIEYRTAPANQISVFDFSALVRSVKSLLARSRPLRPSDTLMKSDATVSSDASAVIDRDRVATPLSALATLSSDVSTWLSTLGALLADPVAYRDAIIAGVDGLLGDAAKLLERATRNALPQAGWGFITEWKRAAFADFIAAVANWVARWDARRADYAAKLAAYNALPAGTTDADRFKALRAMELTVSTALVPLPATPADLLATVQGKQANFQAVRDQFHAIATTGDPSFANLFAAVKALLPISAYDTQPFDLDAFGDRVIVMAQDLQRTLQSQQTAIDARRAATQSDLDTRDNAASVAEQTQAMQAAAQALFGKGFMLYPEFSLDPNQASEWANAYAASTGGNLLKYLTQTANIDFPVDEWLLGVARVRAALHAWEAIVNVATAFGVAEPTLTPVQFPYDPAAPWVAMQFPSTYELASDRLLYTACYGPVGFDGTKPQCGLLVDEWSEVVPVKDSAADLPQRHTGITFNYNRPNSEAPQAILLVTPASNTEEWQWVDLVGALNETLDLAKKRALEPAQIDNTPYASLLPATVMATTLYGISITTSLAAANGAFTQLGMN
jgi:hypothetical protein